MQLYSNIMEKKFVCMYIKEIKEEKLQTLVFMVV